MWIRLKSLYITFANLQAIKPFMKALLSLPVLAMLFAGCMKPAEQPVTAPNDYNCDFEDSTTVKTPPMYAEFRSRGNWVADSARSYPDTLDNNRPGRTITGYGTLDSQKIQVAIWLPYKSPGYYPVAWENSICNIIIDDKEFYNSANACSQSGGVLVTEETADSIKGYFHFKATKAVSGNIIPGMMARGGYFEVAK